MNPDPFAALGLETTADAEEIRAARRRLAQRHHPDRGGDAGRMREINEAADAALAELDRRIAPAASAADPGPETADTADTAGTNRTGRPRADDVDLDGRRVQRDVPSFTVEALPVDTFEGLLVVASWLGETIDDDPPYRLDTYLGEPFDCWCRLDVVPDAGSSTVSLTVGGIDGRPAPDVIAVRDAWVDGLNRLSAPPPS